MRTVADDVVLRGSAPLPLPVNFLYRLPRNVPSGELAAQGTVIFTAIPEPATIARGGGGVLAVGAVRPRRRTA